MMWRILHILAIGAVIASAAYVYGVKYQAIYASEQVVKTRHAIAKERDAINVLRAEYAHLIRPDRLQALADKLLDTQPLALNQIVKAGDLPWPAAKVDSIGLWFLHVWTWKPDPSGVFAPWNPDVIPLTGPPPDGGIDGTSPPRLPEPFEGSVPCMSRLSRCWRFPRC